MVRWNKHSLLYFGAVVKKHSRACVKAFKGKGSERCGKREISRESWQGWVEVGGVRQLRRHESLGEKGCCLRSGHALWVSLFEVRHSFGFWVRQFDSLADAGPTSAPSEWPVVSNATVRPLSSAHQFTRGGTHGMKPNLPQFREISCEVIV
jgi:hypothetical protein